MKDENDKQKKLSNYYICKLRQSDELLNQAQILLEKLIDKFNNNDVKTKIQENLKMPKSNKIVHQIKKNEQTMKNIQNQLDVINQIFRLNDES